jgi:hypothetical protein
MKINYVSLGSFCHPKIVIRETGREYSESLPLDFNSSPSLTGVTNILRELYEKKTYDIELKEIICDHNENELAVSEKNDTFLVHFFKKTDLIENIETYPQSYHKLKKDSVINIKRKFKRRFERLYKLLNLKNEIICFLRIENYENKYWKQELNDFCDVLSLYKNNNKYLIYTQENIDEKLHYCNTNQLNYDYKIPILFYKYYFYDKILIENQELFTNVLDNFEELINNNINVITINNSNIIEKYLIDKDKSKIFKLTNLNNHSDYFMDNNILIINTALYGNQVFKKNIETNVFLNIEENVFLNI